MDKKKKRTDTSRTSRKLDQLSHIAREDNSDVDGSYTGTPKDGGQPVQDADDL